MNFLSHYYFDRNNPSPEQVMGCVLPDLVKNANKNWNFHPEKHEELYLDDPLLANLLAGWKKHLQVDRIFHSSQFFTDHTSILRKLISPALEGSVVRPSFVAHIAVELMLDSLLITEKRIVVEHFYTQLSATDNTALEKFIRLNTSEDIGAFTRFMHSFLNARYLESYREYENIMYAINRICMRIWPEALNDTQRLELSAVLLGYHLELKPVFMEIFDEIGHKLVA